MTMSLVQRLERGPLRVGEPVYTVKNGLYGPRAARGRIHHVTESGLVDVVYEAHLGVDGSLLPGHSSRRFSQNGELRGGRNSFYHEHLDFDIARQEALADQRRRLSRAERITDELSRMFRTRRSTITAALEDIEAAERALAQAREVLTGEG